MSIRGSKSADFIGDFKRFDFAHSGFSETYLERLKEILSKLAVGDPKETIFRTIESSKKKKKKSKIVLKKKIVFDNNIEDARSHLEEIKTDLKSIEETKYNDRINRMILDPDLENTNKYKNKIYALREEIVKDLSHIYEDMVKHPNRAHNLKHKPRIVLLDAEELNKKTINELRDYANKLKNEYESIIFLNIKKPSLNHLFNTIDKCPDKIHRLITIILLVQKDICDLEAMDFKACINDNHP